MCNNIFFRIYRSTHIVFCAARQTALSSRSFAEIPSFSPRSRGGFNVTKPLFSQFHHGRLILFPIVPDENKGCYGTSGGKGGIFFRSEKAFVSHFGVTRAIRAFVRGRKRNDCTYCAKVKIELGGSYDRFLSLARNLHVCSYVHTHGGTICALLSQETTIHISRRTS